MPLSSDDKQEDIDMCVLLRRVSGNSAIERIVRLHKHMFMLSMSSAASAS